MRKESYSTDPTELDPRVFEKLVPPEHARRWVKQCRDCERFRDLLKDGYRAALGRARPTIRCGGSSWPFCPSLTRSRSGRWSRPPKSRWPVGSLWPLVGEARAGAQPAEALATPCGRGAASGPR